MSAGSPLSPPPPLFFLGGGGMFSSNISKFLEEILMPVHKKYSCRNNAILCSRQSSSLVTGSNDLLAS